MIHRLLGWLLIGVSTSAGASADVRWTVMGSGAVPIVRVATDRATCPPIDVDGRTRGMTLRAPAVTLPLRTTISKPELTKPSIFSTRICEVLLPRTTRRASIGGVRIPLPKRQIDRIVVIGDTGCRMKESDDAWQSCNDRAAWPFARIAAAAAAWKPDLVIHVGDYLYRETPCREDKANCAGSTWGYGWDAWYDDFFTPAATLLRAAPWVVVRGNHENCARAGQGWFRLLAPEKLTRGRDCVDPANDNAADYTPAYAIPLGGGTQIVVMDLAIAADKAKDDDPFVSRFRHGYRDLARLAQGARSTIMVTHKPVLGFSGKEVDEQVTLKPGNGAIQSAFAAENPALFPGGVDVLLSGHTHLWEQVSFASNHPSQFITGFSGTFEDVVPLPKALPPGAAPAPGTRIASFSAWTHGFGWMSMERAGARRWKVKVHGLDGKIVKDCLVVGRHSRCRNDDEP